MTARSTPIIGRHLLLPLALCVLALVTLVVGQLVADVRQYLLIAAFAGIPLLFVTLRWFDKAVLLIPFVAIFVPFSLPTGSGSRVPAAMLLVLMLCGIWILTVIVLRRGMLHPSPLNAPLLAFVLIACAAFIWSVVFRDPLLIKYSKFTFVQLAALLAIILSPAAALLIGNFAVTPRALLGIVALFMSAGLLQMLKHFAGVDMSLPNTRGLFSLWLVAICYAIILVHPGLKPVWRIGLLVLLGLYLYIVGIVGVVWLSGWIPALVAILTITLLRTRLGFFALMLALAVVVVTQQGWITRNIIEKAAEDGSFERLTLWSLNFELLQQHPLLGTGPAGYALYYMTYHPTEARSSHNNYLDILAQTGVIGSLCWIWIVVAGLKEARAALRRAPPGIIRTLAFACSGGLVGAIVAMALGDWILPFAYNQGIEGYRYTVYSWIFLGVLMSIRRLVVPDLTAARTNRPGSAAGRRTDEMPGVAET